VEIGPVECLVVVGGTGGKLEWHHWN